MLRISALSSTTTTRAGAEVDMATSSACPAASRRRGEVGPGEDRGGLQQDHQPIADLHDAFDQRRVGGRNVLDLVVFNREDFFNAVDDHAGGLRPRLDDYDLRLLAQLGTDAEPC